MLGSGTIVQQLTDLNLVDEYTLTVVPIILGAGKPLFKNVRPKELKLLAANGLKNGATILRYQPNNSIDGG